MICSNCSNEIVKGSKFCPHCGKSTVNNASAKVVNGNHKASLSSRTKGSYTATKKGKQCGEVKEKTKKENESGKEIKGIYVVWGMLIVIILTVVIVANSCSASIEREMRKDYTYDDWLWDGKWMED